MNWLGSTTIASLWRMCPRMGRKIWFWMLTMTIFTQRFGFLLFAYVIQFRICTQILATLGRTSRVWWMITKGRQKHILNWNPLAIWRNLLNNIHNSRRWQVFIQKVNYLNFRDCVQTCSIGGRIESAGYRWEPFGNFWAWTEHCCGQWWSPSMHWFFAKTSSKSEDQWSRKALMKMKVSSFQNALRLAMLYALRFENSSSNSLNTVLDLLRQRGIANRHIQLIRTLLDYAGLRRRQNDVFGNRSAMEMTKRFIKGKLIFFCANHNFLQVWKVLRTFTPNTSPTLPNWSTGFPRGSCPKRNSPQPTWLAWSWLGINLL